MSGFLQGLGSISISDISEQDGGLSGLCGPRLDLRSDVFRKKKVRKKEQQQQQQQQQQDEEEEEEEQQQGGEASSASLNGDEYD
ncbi:hypothetical protein ElyMa_006493500 [Elysia marginata]|uniref:Uncharacterized protein n=1 Tax=Elysia marginata TaxID=1093978 RepID=A0AAV4I1R8_9GAST|nr:hypothetical protein ElyMa_006493500 [Elysia marginata]